jgi:exodeoxyribonuclease VII large subunit
VGHETDFTIADFVADIRAATPTAAAEIAVPHILELREKIDRLQDRMLGAMRHQVNDGRNRLLRAEKSYVFRQPGRQVLQYQQALDRLQDRLKFTMKEKIAVQQNRWKEKHRMLLSFAPDMKIELLYKQNQQLKHRLERAMNALWRDRVRQADHLMGKLDALSPLKVMGRGYALVFKEDEEKKMLVKSVRVVETGDHIRVKLSDGELACEVHGKKEEVQ